MTIFYGIMIPFLGTCIGSLLVFFIKDKLNEKCEKIFLSVSAGIMFAASIWSLIIPSMEYTKNNTYLKCFPTILGLILGILFFILINNIIEKNYLKNNNYDNNIKKLFIMILAIIIHNIPEGMAVGVMFSKTLSSVGNISSIEAFIFSIGIAIQNIPEGAIVSIPFNKENNKLKSFLIGVLSGIVEPISSIITIFIVKYISVLLPYILSFAAGTMIYVVIGELIPESKENNYKNISIIGFIIGFLIMFVLDVLFV